MAFCDCPDRPHPVNGRCPDCGGTSLRREVTRDDSGEVDRLASQLAAAREEVETVKRERDERHPHAEYKALSDAYDSALADSAALRADLAAAQEENKRLRASLSALQAVAREQADVMNKASARILEADRLRAELATAREKAVEDIIAALAAHPRDVWLVEDLVMWLRALATRGSTP